MNETRRNFPNDPLPREEEVENLSIQDVEIRDSHQGMHPPIDADLLSLDVGNITSGNNVASQNNDHPPRLVRDPRTGEFVYQQDSGTSDRDSSAS